MRLLNVLCGLAGIFCLSNIATAQVLTSEDSLAAGLVSKESPTVLSGYGEARYTVDTRRKNAEASLARTVLFVGHRFNNRISLFTEMELEDALVAGGEDAGFGGEISMEQAFIKFNINPTTYLVAGLFIPRIGLINENHLPTTFNGVDRPFVEQLVIPSTWRELGIGLYGNIKKIPGLNYSVSLTNGLNSKRFTNGTGIKGGEQLGSKASGLGLGASGSLLYYINNFRLQASWFIGGSTALESRVADSLQLNHGAFGNPVMLGEINGQYNKSGIGVRALGSFVKIPDAANINSAFANNTPESLFGAYVELYYNLLYSKFKDNKVLNVFARFEYIDMDAKIAKNGIENGANKQQFIVAGFVFKPIRGVSAKLDYVLRITDKPNEALIVTPFPQTVPYFTSNGFVNLGLAYNF